MCLLGQQWEVTTKKHRDISNGCQVTEKGRCDRQECGLQCDINLLLNLPPKWGLLTQKLS